MKLQESGENYLETILILEKRNGIARSVDVATELGFSKPSVSRAVGLLKQGEYITVDQEGYLHLTAMGEEIAAKMYERHMLLTEFLIRLGVDRETASADACKIEHDISDKSFEAIKRHVNEKKAVSFE